MPIETDKNTNYGGNLVSQKYSPLENIEYKKDDEDYYSALLTNRYNLLKNANILPRPLILAVTNWDEIIQKEAGKKPPLVVISSNRSEWIGEGIAAADSQLTAMADTPTAFDGPSDLRALLGWQQSKYSPPIYCPQRIGSAEDQQKRSVYIVVHGFEYDRYKENLEDTDITVVGWQFKKKKKKKVLTGFGASRFAAIEFCKELRTAAAGGGAAPWDYAWIFDDNVVALTNFPGYQAVEDIMTGADVCAGFSGGTKAETFETNKAWAKENVNKSSEAAAAPVKKAEDRGIIQQASLWNIAYLTENDLNFGPVYISSGEDLSFTNYFKKQDISYVYYKSINVRKEIASFDDKKPAKQVKNAREECTAWFSDAESQPTESGKQPPPPVEITPLNSTDGGVQTLSDFIVNKVLPVSQMGNSASDKDVQNKAKCQAVEQITVGAIYQKKENEPKGRGYLTDDAMDATFKVSGDAAQTVERINQ